MKRFYLLLLIVLVLLPHTPVSADWAYRFVVFSKDIYKVTDETVPLDEIEKKIGEVTRYSDREGTYTGNFSNAFPKGTAYYSIRNKEPKEAIAIKTKDNTYMRAINKGQYGSGSLETQNLSRTFLIVGILIAIVVSIILIRRRQL